MRNDLRDSMRTPMRPHSLVRRSSLRALCAVGVMSVAAAATACAPLGRYHREAPVAESRATPDEFAWMDEPLVDDSVPSVVIRTFKGSPYTNVLAWAGDDHRYGLRSSLREDGTISRGFHSLFLSAELYRQLNMKYGGDWSIFAMSDNVEGLKNLPPARARVFALSGWFRDVHSCEGNKGCTPYEVITARIEDDILRRSATDGLLVRVYGRTANATDVLTLSPAVVRAYLAAFDSVTAVKRAVASRR